MRNSRRNFLINSGKALTVAGIINIPALGSNFLSSNSSKNDTVQIGVIGTGGRGNWLTKLIGNIEGMKVTACCDIQQDRLDKGMSLADSAAKRYTDYRKLLENKDIDAVIVSTPLSLHFEIAKAALQAGKHVYCEKTMVFTYPQIHELEKVYKKSGLVFQVGYQHRYNKLYNWVNEFVNSDKFGKLAHIECYWNRNSDWRRPVSDPKLERLINWRLYKEYSGGLIAELSSHQIDIVDWIVSDHPDSVVGYGGIDFWKDGRETYDNVQAIYDYKSGLRANYTCLTNNAQMGYQMKFYGSKATIQIKGEQGHQAYLYLEPEALDDQEMSKELDAVSGATKKVLEAGDPVKINIVDEGYTDDMPTSKSLESFANCIRTNSKPLVNFENGKMGSIEVLMANTAIYDKKKVMWPDDM